jgi:hypothetical protein
MERTFSLKYRKPIIENKEYKEGIKNNTLKDFNIKNLKN